MPLAAPGGGDDPAALDEIKVYEDEGEEENRTAEDKVAEDKVVLVTDVEEVSSICVLNVG